MFQDHTPSLPSVPTGENPLEPRRGVPDRLWSRIRGPADTADAARGAKQNYIQVDSSAGHGSRTLLSLKSFRSFALGPLFNTFRKLLVGSETAAAAGAPLFLPFTTASGFAPRPPLSPFPRLPVPALPLEGGTAVLLAAWGEERAKQGRIEDNVTATRQLRDNEMSLFGWRMLCC